MSSGEGWAYMFPGQGAQMPGMAADLVDAHESAREVFERGREVLGFDILKICRSGPEEELNSTRVSQPAIFLHSMAVLRILSGGEGYGDHLPNAMAAGLSLGEYSALVFVGSLSFDDALQLVAARGQFMQEACDAEQGAMASILGLPAPRVEEIIRDLAEKGLRVGIANYNSPSQTVISGEESATVEAAEKLKEAGARRTVMLRVAGAYHSPLMASATAGMEPLLRKVEIRAPRMPFYGNYLGEIVQEPEALREGLIRQIENSVRWSQSLEAMVASGMKKALELGPGRVLAGLVRNVDRGVRVQSIGDLEALDKSEGLPV